MPTLTGRGVILRQLGTGDLDALFVIFSDPEVMRYWSRMPMCDRAEAESLLQQIDAGWREGRFYQWGIMAQGAGRVIGTATLFAIERTHCRAELGFALGSSWWGRGLGSAAVETVLRYAFEDLQLLRIEADVDPRNTPSLALLERCGFRREGLLRERFRVGDEVQDSVILGLLRDEWQAGRPGPPV